MISKDPLLAEIMPGYMERRKKDVEDLHTAYKERDFFRIKSICHKVKGNAVTFGFKGLHEICADIDSMLERNETTGIDTKISQLDDLNKWL